jgi:hypothetical protein
MIIWIYKSFANLLQSYDYEKDWEKITTSSYLITAYSDVKKGTAVSVSQFHTMEAYKEEYT